MDQVVQRIWRERVAEIELDEVEVIEWCTQLSISPLVCHLLQQRGVQDVLRAAMFLNGTLADLADPTLLIGMDLAVARLVAAIKNGEKIAIHGDYDVDGITGTAVLCEALTQLGGTVDYHIPLRMRDGYGLSADAIKQSATSGVKLLISVDCGISAVAEAALTAELGLDLIITDHHQPPDVLPQALACINPAQSDCQYPDKHLAGVGVAFMLIIALRASLRDLTLLPTPEPDIRYLLDLVAMGTIADLVPLHGVNRILVKSGLRLLERGERLGVAALKKVADVKRMNAGAVGFKLAPRLNAAGRLEDAALGVQLLLSDNEQDSTALARQLNTFNNQRRAIEQQVLEQAIARVAAELDNDHYTIVLADSSWHSGVIGIVASRLVELFHRPTVLIAVDGDSGKGSARTIAGLHLFDAFQQCSEHLAAFGGHKYAAGLSIDADNVDAFANAFEAHAKSVLQETDLIPVRQYDVEVSLQDVDKTLLTEINDMEPFGVGNPQPVLLCKNVCVQQLAVVAEKHLRFIVQQDGYSHPCIAFGMAQRMAEFNGNIDILFNLTMNVWRNRETLQLQVKDVR